MFLIFAFILYSLDNEISLWIEDHAKFLDTVTGPEFIVFLLDSIEDFKSRYIEYGSDEKSDAQSDSSFDVIRHFEADEKDVPCVILFRDIEKKDVIVIPLEKEWTDDQISDEFQEIATDVSQARRKAKEILGTSKDENEWKEAYDIFWDELKKKTTMRRRIIKAVQTAKTVGSILKQMKDILPSGQGKE